MSYNPIIDFSVGDLVTYRMSTGTAYDPPYVGMVTEVSKGPSLLLQGHLMVFWLNHSSFKGQVKCHYPADMKKIFDKS